MIRLQSWREYVTFTVIIAGAVGLIWGGMIYPYTLDWQAADPVRAEVDSLMSNTNVIGGAQIRAVVKLDSGRKVIVDIPTHIDIRAGSDLILAVSVNADNPKQVKYSFEALAGS